MSGHETRGDLRLIVLHRLRWMKFYNAGMDGNYGSVIYDYNIQEFSTLVGINSLIIKSETDFNICRDLYRNDRDAFDVLTSHIAGYLCHKGTKFLDMYNVYKEDSTKVQNVLHWFGDKQHMTNLTFDDLLEVYDSNNPDAI